MTTKNQNFHKQVIPKKVHDCDVTHQIVLVPGLSKQVQHMQAGDEILFKYVGADHTNGFTINFENTAGAPPDEVIPAGTSEWAFEDPDNDWPGDWYYSIEVNDCNTLALDPVIIIDPAANVSYSIDGAPLVPLLVAAMAGALLLWLILKIIKA